ncbi:MAG: hypothetical protein EPN84_11085 [Legionella sp.]|nr:MAG: hypothetical protein EPN84_11085 [Legionella sp.]
MPLVDEENSISTATTSIVTATTSSATLDQSSPPAIQALTEITSTQEKLNKAQQSLDDIIKALDENPSMISQVARYWESLSTIQRITAGALLVAPTLATGFVVNLAAVFAISSSAGLTVAMGGAVLDEHNYYNALGIQRVKAGVSTLGKILQATILALDKVRQDFTSAITRFQEENARLNQLVTSLDESIWKLTKDVEGHQTTEKFLQDQIAKLEEVQKSLQGSQQEQSELFKKNQVDLDNYRNDYPKIQKKLHDTLEELGQAKQSLGAEVAKAKVVAQTLQTTVSKLVNNTIKDGQQKEAFQAKLQQFLEKSDADLMEFADTMSATQKELDDVKSQLASRNNEYSELLARQEKQLQELTLLVNQLRNESRVPVEYLIRYGFLTNPISDKQQDFVAPTAITAAV